MKVSCPECFAGFDVPQDVLGPRGRRVRCGACGHIWLQEPVSEGGFGGFRGFDKALDIEPIPISVHPDTDDDDDDEPKGPGFFSDINVSYLTRMVAGFVLGFMVLAGGVSALSAAGVSPSVMGGLAGAFGAGSATSGLAIEKLSLRTAQDGHGKTVTEILGRVVNKSGSVRMMPVIDITPIHHDGEAGEGIRIKPEQEVLKSGESVGFAAQLAGDPPAGGEVRVGFGKK